MPCNCKNNVDQIVKLNGETTKEEKKNLFNPFRYILRMPFALLLGVSVILVSVPLALYVTFCTTFAIEGVIKIPNLNKFKRTNNKNQQ